eukprot:CAMPEP_0114402322 /NCGR_PEP_ID=MMETSP0102-20121206/17951_1 /TAXON_ID=38822 ORGANISM="Pteridomonas danica, Strain PT" /NCGR_SAMPLE_ID=MMETSP0102 /ASSEMBLY_ACC=CAM_ASM_000212 /LENGTH=48 /DNA_ID= /DNA_START= /DNA_END= /DNA_ORIENTATION=
MPSKIKFEGTESHADSRISHVKPATVVRSLITNHGHVPQGPYGRSQRQ